LLVFSAALAGCKSTYQVSHYKAPATQIRPEEGVFIIVPQDGPDEPGCGRLAAYLLEGMFLQYSKRIQLSEKTAPLDVQLTNAPAGFNYVLQSRINLWKEEATEWSGLRDKLDMTLRLLRVPGGEVVSETHFEGQSKSGSWGGDRVEHLLKEIGGKWVGALYGRAEFQQTSYKGDKPKK